MKYSRRRYHLVADLDLMDVIPLPARKDLAEPKADEEGTPAELRRREQLYHRLRRRFPEQANQEDRDGLSPADEELDRCRNA